MTILKSILHINVALSVLTPTSCLPYGRMYRPEEWASSYLLTILRQAQERVEEANVPKKTSLINSALYNPLVTLSDSRFLCLLFFAGIVSKGRQEM